jgi:hypothetical protein
MNPRGVLLCGLLAVCITVLAGPAGGGDKDAKKYDSPQTVFDAATKAAKDKDWKTLHGCLTRDSRDVLTGQIAFLGLFFRGVAGKVDPSGKAAEKLAPLETIYKKHGLTKEVLEKMKKDSPKASQDPKEEAKAMKKLAEPIKDQVGFITAVLKVLDEANPKQQKNPLGDAKLKDVKVDGDKATGTQVTKSGDKEKEQTVTFVKEGGGWRMVLPLPQMGGKPGG